MRSSLAISGVVNPFERRYADRLEELIFCIFDYEKKARGVDFLAEECQEMEKIIQEDTPTLQIGDDENKKDDFFFQRNKNGKMAKMFKNLNMDIFTVTEMSNDNGSIPTASNKNKHLREDSLDSSQNLRSNKLILEKLGNGSYKKENQNNSKKGNKSMRAIQSSFDSPFR